MSQNLIGYNNGRYDLQKQTFCMSMLTCLSFNLTGPSAETITEKFKASVENVLSSDAAKELIGIWKLVWGPVVYADSFVGAKASVNSMFIAVPEAHPEQAVLAIAGTNGNSLMSWMMEDFNVKEKVSWSYGGTSLNPHISKGIAFGLEKLQALTEKNAENGVAMTARDYLAANPSITQIMVTGHSLGGALSPVYSLYLEDTRSEWNGSRLAVISCLATAGQTPGDEGFSKYYAERLSSTTRRVWNSLDIVPHAFQKDTLLEIPAIYEPNILSQKPIEKLIASLRRDTEVNNYLNILPEVEGFPSSFLKLEDIAGEKYKTFIDFIDNVVAMVKKINLFGANGIIGSIDFVVHALIQHIFPYFTYFGIDDFIKIMGSTAKPPPKPKPEDRSVWELLGIFWGRWEAIVKRNILCKAFSSSCKRYLINFPQPPLAQFHIKYGGFFRRDDGNSLHRAQPARLFQGMASTKDSTSEKNLGEALVNPPVVIDLGQKTKNKINRMKKGEGPLYDAVCETVEVLQSDGIVGKEVQVVLVVVEKLPDGFAFPNLSWN